MKLYAVEIGPAAGGWEVKCIRTRIPERYGNTFGSIPYKEATDTDKKIANILLDNIKDKRMYYELWHMSHGFFRYYDPEFQRAIYNGQYLVEEDHALYAVRNERVYGARELYSMSGEKEVLSVCNAMTGELAKVWKRNLANCILDNVEGTRSTELEVYLSELRLYASFICNKNIVYNTGFECGRFTMEIMGLAQKLYDESREALRSTSIFNAIDWYLRDPWRSLYDMSRDLGDDFDADSDVIFKLEEYIEAEGLCNKKTRGVWATARDYLDKKSSKI